MTKEEAEKFLGQEVAITFDEDDEQFFGVQGRLTKVDSEVVELDNDEDELCTWRLSEIRAIELLSNEWDQPFRWIGDVR